MGRVTLGWFVIQKLGFVTVCLCAKFDDSSHTGSRDIGAPECKVGHVTLTTSVLKGDLSLLR